MTRVQLSSNEMVMVNLLTMQRYAPVMEMRDLPADVTPPTDNFNQVAAELLVAKAFNVYPDLTATSMVCYLITHSHKKIRVLWSVEVKPLYTFTSSADIYVVVTGDIMKGEGAYMNIQGVVLAKWLVDPNNFDKSVIQGIDPEMFYSETMLDRR